jgi:thioredoxin 2
MRVVCPHCLQVNNIPQKESYKKANCGSCKKSLLETNLIDLDESNFDHVVANSDIPVVVDFWAAWCGPCKMMAPTFAKVSKEFALKILFVKVDTEKAPNISARFGIRSIPTLVLMKDGKETTRTSGALDETRLRLFVSN